MRTSSSKWPGILFSIVSAAMLILVLLFIFVYQPADGTWRERLSHMEESWALVAMIWRLEFLTVLITAWLALYFARSQNAWWYFVAIGHILMLFEYALMLGGYPYIISEELFDIVNNVSVWIFAASNLIWQLGILGVYLSEKGWFKYLGGALSLLGILVFLSVLLDITTMSDVIFYGPIGLLLYLVNFFYGYKVLRLKEHSSLHI